MNTLKLNRRPLIPLIVINFFIFFPLLSPFRSETKVLLEIGWLPFFLAGSLVLVIWMTVIRIKENFSYRIAFTDEAIEENHSLGFATSLPKRILYSDIRSVRYVFPDIISISSTSDKSLKINLAEVDGGAKLVLNVLKNNLPVELIGEHLPTVVEKNSFLSRIVNFGYLLFFVAVLIPTIYGFRSPFKGGWNEYHVPWSEEILQFSVSRLNLPWVVSTDFNSEKLIVRYDEKEWDWTRPQPGEDGKTFPWVVVLSDIQGQPTLIGSEVNKTWQNGAWTQWKYYGAYSLIPITGYFVNTNEKAWLVLSGGNGERDLVVATAGKTSVDLIKLPEFAEQRKYQPALVSLLPDETVLVLAGNKEESKVFLLKDGNWLEKSYQVPFSNINRVQGFTLDASGRLYLLFYEDFKDKRFVVEMVDGETVTATHFVSDSSLSYLLIDAGNRVWVFLESYGGGVMVLQPVWGGEAELVAFYSENNSNFPAYLRSAPEISADGKIWVLGGQLLWLDGTASELPRPLPDWLADFSDIGSLKKMYYFMWTAFVFFIGSLVLKLMSNRISK